MRFRNVAAGIVLAGLLAAQAGAGDLAGEYGQNEAGQWFTILDLQEGGAATLTMIGSEDRFEGNWSQAGDSVDVTAAGETRTLSLGGDGCLDGGLGNSFFAGTVCRKP